MRARLENIPILLGSATPSLESWHNAQRGQYTLLRLPKRVLDLPMPPVQLDRSAPRATAARPLSLDQSSARTSHARSVARPGAGHLAAQSSRLLHHCPVPVVRTRGDVQALRSGFDAFTRRATSCSATTAATSRTLPATAAACGKETVRYQGQGTEKLQAEIEDKFPEYIIRRVDSDSMRQRGSHEQVLSAFAKG